LRRGTLPVDLRLRATSDPAGQRECNEALQRRSSVSNLLILIGRVAGIFGVVLGAASVAARAMGMFFIGTLQVGTLLQASIASMVLGALAYAAAVAERRR
jgi:hypothetical protein